MSRQKKLSFCCQVAELEHLLDTLVPDNWFENANDQDDFIDDLARQRPQSASSYEEMCRHYQFRGHEVAEEDLPPAVCRAVDAEMFREALEEYYGIPLMWETVEDNMSGAQENPEWERLDRLVGARSSRNATFRLSKPVNHSVFVTFRDRDPEAGVPQPGLVDDAVAESSTALPGGVAERIDHHLALNSVPFEGLTIIRYHTNAFETYKVPVAPDAGTHECFRPISPRTSDYGLTRPDIAGECPRCPDCQENELVHENAELPARQTHLAFIRSMRQ